MSYQVISTVNQLMHFFLSYMLQREDSCQRLYGCYPRGSVQARDADPDDLRPGSSGRGPDRTLASLLRGLFCRPHPKVQDHCYYPSED